MLTLVLFAISCSFIESGIKTVDKHVTFSWEESNKKAIDSLKIDNKATYHILDCNAEDFEKEFSKDGYNWWILKVGNKYRIEVSKNDSLIYIFGKWVMGFSIPPPPPIPAYEIKLRELELLERAEAIINESDNILKKEIDEAYTKQKKLNKISQKW